MAETAASAMILFKSSNACSAPEDKGNDLQLVIGLIVREVRDPLRIVREDSQASIKRL